MRKLTKRTIDTLAPGDSDYTVWDREVAGFGCRVHPKGRKTFIFKYRVGGGRAAAQRKMTLGPYGEGFTVDQARTMAKQANADVLQGRDPAGQRSQHRAAETLETFSKRYMSDHATPMKKPRSVTNDRWLLDRHILPKLGSHKVVDLTSGHIVQFVRGLADRPILANRCRSLLSKMCSLAISWGVRGDRVNPVHGVDKFPERSRERFLAADEIKRLGEALRAAEADATEPWQAIAAIRLLLFTGCRRGEVLSLQWSFVDRDNDVLLLPDSKTGRKTIYLTAPVIETLDALPRKDGCAFVLPGRSGDDRHFEGVGHVWERIRSTAGLQGVRLHDLRHTFASKGAGLGLGLPLIGALLGHTNPATTAKYAHLAADPTRKAGARIARRLHSELGATATVIPFAGARKAQRKETGPTPVQRAAGGKIAERSEVTVPTVRSVRDVAK